MAVPAVTVVLIFAQLNVGLLTVNVPLQEACIPLQAPVFGVALTLLYVPAAGLLQVGALVQLMLLLLTVLPLQVTVGGVIAVPAVPELGTLAQEIVDALEELGAMLEELGAMLEELGATLEELGAMLEELGTALEELGAMLEELGAMLEELGAKDELERTLEELGVVPVQAVSTNQ